MVEDNASVDTPRSAATCRRGSICNSGRSSSAVEAGFSSDGRVRISLASWLAVSLITFISRPAIMSCRSRWPLSLRNQKPHVGQVGHERGDVGLQILLAQLALGLVDEVDDEARLARLRRAAQISVRRTPAPSAPRGIAFSRSEIARVTRSVSSSREPGGSSTANSARARSSAGMKPDGSSRVDQIEAAKISGAEETASPSASAPSRARGGCSRA